MSVLTEDELTEKWFRHSTEENARSETTKTVKWFLDRRSLEAEKLVVLEMKQTKARMKMGTLANERAVWVAKVHNKETSKPRAREPEKKEDAVITIQARKDYDYMTKAEVIKATKKRGPYAEDIAKLEYKKTNKKVIEKSRQRFAPGAVEKHLLEKYDEKRIANPERLAWIKENVKMFAEKKIEYEKKRAKRAKRSGRKKDKKRRPLGPYHNVIYVPVNFLNNPPNFDPVPSYEKKL